MYLEESARPLILQNLSPAVHCALSRIYLLNHLKKVADEKREGAGVNKKPKK